MFVQQTDINNSFIHNVKKNQDREDHLSIDPANQQIPSQTLLGYAVSTKRALRFSCWAGQ